MTNPDLAQYSPRSTGIMLRTYVSYINRRGQLIVRSYMGETELKGQERNIKEMIGTFGATDLEAARATANRLRGVKTI